MRVVPVLLGRLDQAHHRRRSLSPAQRARKQPVVPANCNWPDLVLDPVVVHRQLTVFEETCQSPPAPQAVIDRFGRSRAFGHLLPAMHQPLIQGLHQQLAFVFPYSQSLFATEIFDLPLHRIDLRHLPDCLFGNLALVSLVANRGTCAERVPSS